MSGPPEARGRALLGPILHVREVHGPAALATLSAEASPSLRAILERKIRQGAWYSYDAYVELLRLIDRLFGQGDLALCRTLGVWAGKQDLGSMFRIYALLASAERLIRASRLVWPQYYRNAGTMDAITTSPSDTCLRIEGFPAMDPAHCRLMEGWMASTMEQIGCRLLPGGRETVCASEGGPYHEFRCTWERSA